MPRRATVEATSVWDGTRFIWKQPQSWMPQLGSWLIPRFRKDGLARLKPGNFRDLCWDDSDWLQVLDRCLKGDINEHVVDLAQDLERATLRTFHGCRTEDAGIYFREGLRVHDRKTMIARVQAIVDSYPKLAWMKSRLAEEIADVPSETDIGRVYVVADDTVLVRDAAHYLIYGSEWITAVLGPAGQSILKSTGAPTLLEIDLPLAMTNTYHREAFANIMLREWARVTCNEPDWFAPINFTFTLTSGIPPSCIVGHSHPAILADPLNSGLRYVSSKTTCVFCEQ